MATNLAINQELLNKALDISGLKTKKDTVNLALKQFEITKLFGKMEPDADYDYKKGRTRSRFLWIRPSGPMRCVH